MISVNIATGAVRQHVDVAGSVHVTYGAARHRTVPYAPFKTRAVTLSHLLHPLLSLTTVYHAVGGWKIPVVNNLYEYLQELTPNAEPNASSELDCCYHVQSDTETAALK